MHVISGEVLDCKESKDLQEDEDEFYLKIIRNYVDSAGDLLSFLFHFLSY